MAKLKRMNWLIIPCVALIIVIGSVVSCSSDKTTNNDSVVTSENTEIAETEPVIEPMVVTVDELVEDYNFNEIQATNTYKNKYVKLTGIVGTIDNDGNYFDLNQLQYSNIAIKNVQRKDENGILGMNIEFTTKDTSDNEGDRTLGFGNVQCNIEEHHLDTIMNFVERQEVTVIGTIKTVGPMGFYILKVESIK
jgi:hypothetical protein